MGPAGLCDNPVVGHRSLGAWGAWGPWFVAAWLAASPVVAVAQAPAEAAEAAYQVLIGRVRQTDRSVDFLQVRRLFTESRTYRPYADSREEAMLDALDERQPARALEIARAILDANYLNIEAHFAGTVACSALMDNVCAAHHQFVAQGLLNSIAASGDGKAPESAFAVVSAPEEYAIARVMGADVQEQARRRTIEGHTFDVLTIENPKTGDVRQLYFNVDLAEAAMARLLARE